MKRNPDFTTALHPDNASRNRYKDVLPYEENRVRLTPTKDNKMGYVNASHITVSGFDFLTKVCARALFLFSRTSRLFRLQ